VAKAYQGLGGQGKGGGGPQHNCRSTGTFGTITAGCGAAKLATEAKVTALGNRSNVGQQPIDQGLQQIVAPAGDGQGSLLWRWGVADGTSGRSTGHHCDQLQTRGIKEKMVGLQKVAAGLRWEGRRGLGVVC